MDSVCPLSASAIAVVEENLMAILEHAMLCLLSPSFSLPLLQCNNPSFSLGLYLHAFFMINNFMTPSMLLCNYSAGCGVLYAGQGKFHNSTTRTLEYVVNQADVTAENLRNVSDYLAAAKNAGVLSVFLPTSVRNDIDSIQTKINSSGATLSSTTQKNSEGIQDVLDTMSVKALKTSSGSCLVLEFFITAFTFYCALQKIDPDYPCCCNACSGISWIW